MSRSSEFDVILDPVVPGKPLLIEASAGTGKTYAIENLYLRLLLTPLENGRFPEVREILVVTYTEAATAELKTRTRACLADALRSLDAPGGSEENPRADSLSARLLRDRIDAGCSIDVVRDRLRLAVVSFDEAAIFTIHGFCARALSENAFENAAAFDVELLPDDSAIIAEEVADFWRKLFYPPYRTLFAGMAKNGRLSPETLTRIAIRMERHPDIVPRIEDVDGTPETPEAFDAAFQRCLDDIREFHGRSGAALTVAFPDLENILKTAPLKQWRAFYRDIFFRVSRGEASPEEIFSLAGFFQDWDDRVDSRKAKKWAPPEALREFIGLCEALTRQSNAFAVFVKKLFVQRLRDGALRERKRERQVKSFGDLLLDLRQGLRDRNGAPDREGPAARALRERYRIVMIDEFQDTDPVQYEIFETAFHHPSTILIMVGDPKQSVYSFRGADLFAYLRAARNMPPEQVKTLAKNYRSSPAYLRAVNAIFAAPFPPFVDDRVRFDPAVRGEGLAAAELVIDDGSGQTAPLRCWFLSGSDDMKRQDAVEFIADAVAGEVRDLLTLADNGRAFFVVNGGVKKPPRPSDIAVLVNTNYQARDLYERLRLLGVPTVLRSSENVFDSFEAQDLFRVLTALAEPGRERPLKTALASAMIGLSARRLAELDEDPAAAPVRAYWEDLFARYRDLWARRGFLQAFARFLEPEPPETYEGLPEDPAVLRKNVRANLLALPDGPRRVANLLCLVDLVHRAVEGGKLGPNGTVSWLREQILEDKSASDEAAETPLESDDDAVAILTIHKSKGLQFPIVFCPFVWNDTVIPGRTPETDFDYCLESADGTSRRFLDISADPAAGRLLYRREKLAEKLRLFYVALTRARSLCYLPWANVGAADTPLGYLRTWWPPPPTGTTFSDTLLAGSYLRNGEKKTDAQFGFGVADAPAGVLPGYRRWEDSGAIAFQPPPKATKELYVPPVDDTPLAARRKSRPVPYWWGVMSFSGLIGDRDHREENPREDDIAVTEDASGLVEASPTPDETAPFADFPGGRLIGTCVHETLAEIDFGVVADPEWASRPEWARFLGDKARAYGFAPPADDAASGRDASERLVCRFAAMIANALNTPLPRPDGTRFRLRDVPASKRLNEVNFFYPVSNALRAEILAERLRQMGLPLSRNAFPETIDRLTLAFRGGKAPRTGFMTGDIDLFFQADDGKYYILDWKTTRIGRGRRDDYAPAKLFRNMIDSAYVLQYLIYALAADRYLAQRLGDAYDYDRDFGGVYYLYLRGMNGSDADTGVFYDRPSADAIAALRTLFFGEGAEATFLEADEDRPDAG